MSLASAIEAERRGNVSEAAARYEDAIGAGDRSLQVLLNLAVLYWRVLDPGSGNEVRPEPWDTASRRLPELLGEARRRYPESVEARFWERYIRWMDFGGAPLGREECLDMLRDDPSCLTPAMHLLVASDGKEAREEARELLRKSRNMETIGARYVVSVIEELLRES